MKQNLFFKSVLSTVAILCSSVILYAGNPVLPKEEPAAPKTTIRNWCEIRGVFERATDSDGNALLICRMVADNFCYSIPCWVGMPIGNKPPTKSPVPQGVNIEEGQSFIAYYENNALKVVLTDKLSSNVTEDQQGAQTVIVTIGQ
ncbi:MAG: hypothetical protein P0Y49_09295 [Candidatus Pedobacter colombiensis]|uniref:Uncharacterized protein n=1 Tax=Candidatus Pedobacter colombiensis TaxID=3121371 RepID=A0AAJ5WBN0_9SPHI|nr:hypothetical protein [Pedobacter sp.]WEK21335.1 MAG: hypothetical protein P0Y49_09295 [Pedobacter sp.]